MADITYCAVSDCPFTECSRNIVHLSKCLPSGQDRLVSIASMPDGCKRYFDHLAEMKRNASPEDICGATGLPCIKCNPGGCDHRKESEHGLH